MDSSCNVTVNGVKTAWKKTGEKKYKVVMNTMLNTVSTVSFEDYVFPVNGEKLGDSDLIGIPHRLVVSQKTLAENKIEYKNRRESDSKLLSLEEVLGLLK